MASTKKKPATPRKAAKPPVINLKATEVKSTTATGAVKKDSTTGRTGTTGTTSATGAAKPAATKSAATKPAKAKPAETKTEAAKPDSVKAETAKPSAGKSTATKPAMGKPAGDKSDKPVAAKKKSSRSGLVVASLVALLAAGAGGAWAYKTYGAQYFGIQGAVSTDQLASAVARIEKLEKGLSSQADKNVASTNKISELIAGFDKQISQNKASVTANNKKLVVLEKTASEIRTALAKAVENNQGPVAAANKLQFDAISEKIAGLEEGLTTLKNNQVKDSSGDVANLKSRFDAIIIRLKAAEEQAVATGQLMDAVKAEQEKLANAPTSNPAAELAKAFTILRARILHGTSFVAELDNVAGQLPSATSLDVLRPFARSGAPTLASLKKALMDVPVRAAQKTGDQMAQTDQSGEGGVFDAVTRRLSGLVKVSKVGETDWEVLKKQALQMLDSGQVDQAVNLLKGKAATPPAIEKWLTLADSKVQLDQAVEQLTATIMARLTPASQ